MHWEKVQKIMSDQCTSHRFCCINICASSCGPLKRSPLEKIYNVCKNYDAKNFNKWIQRKINAYVNIKTDSLQDLIWIPTCMKLNMINYETFKPCTCTTEKEKRSDEFAKGNKKEQMLLLAAKYSHMLIQISQTNIALCILSYSDCAFLQAQSRFCLLRIPLCFIRV